MAKTLKITAAFIASAVMAALPLATSCTDYDNGFDEAAIRYNQNFRELFGDIDPNQDWNLVRQLAEKNGGGMNTRAYDYGDNVADANSPNRNEWYKDENLNRNGKIPGWPDEIITYPDRAVKTFYVEGQGDGDRGANRVTYKKEDEVDVTKDQPIGDLTEEEVIYVSQWFRSHYKPTSLKANWKNFYIQHVSHDVDREIYQDAKGNYTCDEGERKINFPIYNANGTILSDESNNKDEEFAMNQLWAKREDGVWQHLYNFNYEIGNRFEKFDRAPGFVLTEDGKPTKTRTGNQADYNPTSRKIMLYTGVGTNDFSYHCNYDESRYRKWVMVHLEFDIPQEGTCDIHQMQCTNHHYNGYYLGFDYQAYKETYDGNGNIEKYVYRQRDGFYSNWIVKLTFTKYFNDDENPEDPEPDPTPDDDEEDPTPPSTMGEQGLLVCEDLGDYDFDFNDIVLKLQHIKKTDTDPDKLRITAMAAGGTLPSKIYYKNEETPVVVDGVSEIHALLNSRNQNLTPINAGPQFGKEGKSWTVDISDEDMAEVERIAQEKIGYGLASYVFDKGYIKIKVDDKTWISKIRSGYQYHTDEDGYTEGKVPQMMFLPLGFQWPQEEKRIDRAYPKFAEWVGDITVTDWYKYENSDKTKVTKRTVTESEVVDAFEWVDNIEKLVLVIREGNTLSIRYKGVISEVKCESTYATAQADNDNHTLTITSTGLGNNASEKIEIVVYDDNKKEYRINVTMIKEDVVDDGTLKWDDGSTHKTISVVKDQATTVYYRNADNITINGESDKFENDYVRVTKQNDSSLEIFGKAVTDNDITITVSDGEGTNITLVVKVIEAGGEQPGEKQERPQYGIFGVSGAKWDENSKTIDVYIEKSFQITAYNYGEEDILYGNIIKQGQKDGISTNVSVTKTNKKDGGQTIIDLEAGDYVGTAILTLTLPETDTYAATEIVITINVLEPEGTRLTPVDEDGKIYKVKDVLKAVGSYDKVKFTFITDVLNHNCQFLPNTTGYIGVDGLYNTGFVSENKTTEVTVNRNWFDSIAETTCEEFKISCDGKIISLYVQGVSSSAKKRPIRRK